MNANEESILNEQWNAANMAFRAEAQRSRPFMLLRPRIYMDGNQWCALYGDNLQDGVCGFGDTPELAAQEFDKMWNGVKS